MESTVGQLELALLRAQLHTFERRFYKDVGPLYVQLDQARAQAAAVKARYIPQANHEAIAAQRDADLSAEECKAMLDQPPPEPEPLKRLHRELARQFHPDFAPEQAHRAVCENLMAEINEAYQQQDYVRLKLLGKAREQDQNGDSVRQLAALAASPPNQIREQTEYAGRRDRDLLQQLNSYLLKLIEEAYLSGARLEYARPDFPNLLARAVHDLTFLDNNREITFPEVRSLGELFTRAIRDIDSPLKGIGWAQGQVTAPFNKAVILRLAGNSRDLRPLLDLDPADLQGLVDERPNFISLDDEELQPLARFGGLEVLSLGRTEVTGRLFDHFPTLHELRILRLDETQFDDAGLRRLEECVWMQHLDLAMTRVTGQGIGAIRNMTALRELNLYETQIHDGDLAVLDRIPGIRKLNLGLTKVTDACAAHIGHLRSLEVLNLGGTRVTDAILDSLALMPNLKELVLWETSITDAGLRKIEQFEALRYLDLDHTRITREALKWFRPTCPEVQMPSDLWAEDFPKRS